MSRVRSVLAIAGCLVAISVATGTAWAQGSVELTSEEPLELTSGGTVSATVVNSTNEPVEVEFVATVAKGDVRIVLDVEPAMVTLDAGQSAGVTISAPAAASVEDTFKGEITASTGAAVARLDLELAPPTTPKPAVAKRTLNVYAWTPLPPSVIGPLVADGNPLPVVGETCPAAPASFAAGGGPDSITITPRCDGDDLILDPSGFQWNAHHDYEGVLKSGGGEATVTVRYSTVVLWPLAMLVFGVLIAIRIYAWQNGRRDLKSIRLRLVELAAEAPAADTAFATAAAGRSWDRYRIADHVETEAAKHIAAVDDIGSGTWSMGLLTEQQQKALTKLAGDAAPLDTLVIGWSDAHTSLFAPLDALRTSATWTSEWDCATGMRGWADGLLAPDAPAMMTTKTYTQATAELLQAESALELVKTFLFYSVRLDTAPADTGSITTIEKARAARRDLGDRFALGVDGSMPPSEVAALADQISEFRTLVNAIPQPAIALESIAAREDEEVAVADRLAAVVEMLRAATAQDVDAVRAWTITSVDKRIAAIVGLAAVWSGLVALYFGKPWGNFVDYGTAALWAFTATAVVTPLITALTQQRADRFRLRASE